MDLGVVEHQTKPAELRYLGHPSGYNEFTIFEACHQIEQVALQGNQDSLAYKRT